MFSTPNKLYLQLQMASSIKLELIFFYKQGMEADPSAVFTESLTDGHKVSLKVKQKNQLCKKRRVKTWSQEQDQQLISLYQQHPKRWALIASLMCDRNENQCLHRYRRIAQNGVRRKIWSAEEDEWIKGTMKKVGKNWKVLSELMGSKTGKQIRERFINKLDPKIKKEEWSDEEDRKIIELYCLVGRKWSEISKQLPGRPQNKIKNRFYSFIQKNYDITCNSLTEDQYLQGDLRDRLNAQQNRQRLQPLALDQLQPLSRDQVQTLPKQQQSLLQEKAEERTSFKDILNQAQPNAGSARDAFTDFKDEKSAHFILPSINQLDFQMKLEDFGDENASKRSRNVIGSMIKIDQEWAKEKDSYHFGPASQFQTDLFYLSGN